MRAIIELAAGADVSKAAEAAGVERETVSRWKQNPDFKAALVKIESETAADATRRLAGLLDKTVDELEALLSKVLDPVDKIRVIRTILTCYPRMAEITSIDSRISEIEETLKHGTQSETK